MRKILIAARKPARSLRPMLPTHRLKVAGDEGSKSPSDFRPKGEENSTPRIPGGIKKIAMVATAFAAVLMTGAEAVRAGSQAQLITHVCYFGCHDKTETFNTHSACLNAMKLAQVKYWKDDMPATRLHYTFECTPK